MDVQPELRLELLGIKLHPVWFFALYMSQDREDLAFTLHKTRKDVKTKNFCFLCFSLQRNCNQKNSHCESKSYNTMCFSPKDCPSSSLSVKQSPLTCLGQDLGINGCQMALSLVVCCRSYGSRVENLSLNESEQSFERLHGSQICLQGIQQFVRLLLFCDIAFMGVEPEY